MKPIILITGEEGFDSNFGTANFILNRKYSDYIAKSGGLPLMPEDIRAAKEYVKIADGLFLPDGPDIHRGRYHKYYTRFEEMRNICSSRDDFEFTLFRLFYEAKKPILGLGRGTQVINSSLGGSHYMEAVEDSQELNSSFEPDSSIEVKPYLITFNQETNLHNTLGKELLVSGFSSQHIESIGDGLKVAAFSSHSVIEAFEHEHFPIIGIRKNPENDKEADILFHYFIKLAKENSV